MSLARIRCIPVFFGLMLMALALMACGEEGGDDTPAELPCGGACPAAECVLGMCQVNMPDAGPGMDVMDPEPDPTDPMPDAQPMPDVPTDAQPDPEPTDVIEEVPDVEDESEPDVVDPGCLGDVECGPGEICDERLEPAACRTGCREDDQCGPEEICNTILNECVLGCTDDDDCLDSETCSPQLRVCVGTDCTRDRDCAAEQFCNRNVGLCVAGCRELGCEPGERCDLAIRACFPGCNVDENCPEGQYCDEDGEVCIDGCRDDDECEEDGVCELVQFGDEPPAQQCVPPQCGRDRDCSRDEYCAEIVEVDRFECAFGCRTDPDNCGPGTACDPEQRRCVALGCQNDDECPGALVCVPGPDELFVCQNGCREDDQCGDGQVCLDERFVCSCEVNDDCPGQLVCEVDGCVEPCTGDSDCPEGLTCDLEIQLCTDGCLDDGFEPNDAIGEETPIESNTNLEMRMCYEETPLPDCFRIDQIGFGLLTIDLGFRHSAGDLNVFLIDPDFVEIAREESTTDNESIEVSIEIPGPHIFCVEAVGEPFGGLSYTLDVTFLSDE